MPTELERTYKVAAGNVSLTVIIGEGQLGASSVRLGNNAPPLAKGAIKNLPVGAGSAIAGKQLFIKTVVTDVNDNTDFTTVRYELKGGKLDETFDLTEEAEEEGGSVIYRATFNLES